MTKSGDKSERTVEYRDIEVLVPYAQNPRKHPKRQMAALQASIRKFGFGTAVAVWQDNMILAGHGRVEAAKLEGVTRVPVIDLSDMSFERARAFVIADNKTSDLAGWDEELLKSELEELDALEDLDFELGDLGFSDRELMKFLPDFDVPPGTAKARPQGTNDPEIAAKDGPAIVVEGDLWRLGNHKLICGDSADPKNWTKIMAGAQAALLFTDPPYGVSYSEKNEALNKNPKLGTARNTEKIANDVVMNPGELTEFLTGVFGALRPVMGEGCSYYVCGPGGDMGHAIMEAMLATDIPLRHSIVWVKNKIVFGRADYHYQHEMILFGWVKGAHKFYGPQNESTVWECDLPMSNGLHPTMKPVALVERAIRNSSKAGDIVIDAFGGSGSTLMACENRGRHAHLIELSPTYCDRILRRWRLATGGDPVREDGRKLSELEAEQDYLYTPTQAKAA